jgi:hypothetical protein
VPLTHDLVLRPALEVLLALVAHQHQVHVQAHAHQLPVARLSLHTQQTQQQQQQQQLGKQLGKQPYSRGEFLRCQRQCCAVLCVLVSHVVLLLVSAADNAAAA